MILCCCCCCRQCSCWCGYHVSVPIIMCVCVYASSHCLPLFPSAVQGRRRARDANAGWLWLRQPHPARGVGSTSPRAQLSTCVCSRPPPCCTALVRDRSWCGGSDRSCSLQRHHSAQQRLLQGQWLQRLQPVGGMTAARSRAGPDLPQTYL